MASKGIKASVIVNSKKYPPYYNSRKSNASEPSYDESCNSSVASSSRQTDTTPLTTYSTNATTVDDKDYDCSLIADKGSSDSASSSDSADSQSTAAAHDNDFIGLGGKFDDDEAARAQQRDAGALASSKPAHLDRHNGPIPTPHGNKAPRKKNRHRQRSQRRSRRSNGTSTPHKSFGGAKMNPWSGKEPTQ